MAMRRMRARPAGFTLMEMLVTLMLVSFASMLMFQMLGSYRVAKERAMAQSGAVDRQALFAAWFRDSVQGLHASERIAFKGEAMQWSGPSLNAAYLTTGVPVEAGWSLARESARTWELRYLEDGEVRWTLQLAYTGRARFVYLDEKGEPSPEWPAKLGVSLPLPAAIALVREDEDGTPMPTILAAVRGTRKPPYAPFELEQE
ncbi:type II secretion system protein [Thermomonas brevis]